MKRYLGGWLRLACVISPIAGLVTAFVLPSTGFSEDAHFRLFWIAGRWFGLSKTNIWEFVFGLAAAFTAILLVPQLWLWICAGFRDNK